MNSPSPSPGVTEWICGRCAVPLATEKVRIGYLGSLFIVDVVTCPSCGMSLIPEEMAMGKMAEAEQLLEDK